MTKKKSLLTWTIMLIFLMSSIFSTGVVFADDSSETGAYGWTMTYTDPKTGETESIPFEFDSDYWGSIELPCALKEADIWDSVKVSGYDSKDNYVEMDMKYYEEDDCLRGEVYMYDIDGWNTRFAVVIEKKYHDEKRIKSVDATCTEYGYIVYECKSCGYTRTFVDEGYLESHSWGSKYIIDKKATYFNSGKKSYHCKVCNISSDIHYEIIPKKVLSAPFIFGASITPDLSRTGGYDDLRVSWEKVKDATGYQVQYRLKGASKWQNYNSGKWTAKNKVYLKDMKDGKYYQVRVRARIKEGSKVAYSKWASEYSCMTLAKVTGLSVKDASGSYVTVKWKGLPTDGEDGYQIYRATSKNGKYTKVAEVYQKTKTYPSKKVKAKKGKTYWYKVRSFSRWDGEHYLYGPWSTKVKCTR